MLVIVASIRQCTCYLCLISLFPDAKCKIGRPMLDIFHKEMACGTPSGFKCPSSHECVSNVCCPKEKPGNYGTHRITQIVALCFYHRHLKYLRCLWLLYTMSSAGLEKDDTRPKPSRYRRLIMLLRLFLDNIPSSVFLFVV